MTTIPARTSWAIMAVVVSLSNLPLVPVAAVPCLFVMMRHTPSGTVGGVAGGVGGSCVTAGVDVVLKRSSKFKFGGAAILVSAFYLSLVCGPVRNSSEFIVLCSSLPTTLLSLKRIVSEPLTRLPRYSSSSSLSVSFLP